MSDNEARIVLTAKDTTGPAFSKVKVGLQSISDQLALAKQRIERFAAGFIVLKEIIQPALEAFRELSHSALENADQLVKVSQRTGIAVETLSQLSVAARLADTDLGGVADAAKHFSGLMLEAATGSKQANALLKGVGVDLKDDLGTALLKIGDLLARLPAGWQKNAISVALFKKSGDQMIPFFNSLREGTKRAKELNLTIGKETGEAAEKFKDNLTILRLQLEKLVLTMGDKNRPAINAFLEALQEGLARGGLIGAIQAALGEFAKLGGILGFIAGLLRDHGRAVLNLAGIYAGLKITAIVRELVVAQVQSIAAIRQTIVAATSEAAARTASARAVFVQADAARIYTAALVLEAEAAVAASVGMARLTLVENLLIPRQQAAAVAAGAASTAQAALAASTTGAATAASLFGRTIAFLGGPIGAIITVLGIATTVWAIFGSTAKKAGDEAREGVDEALKQAKRLKQTEGGGQFAPQIQAEIDALEELKQKRAALAKQAEEIGKNPELEFVAAQASIQNDLVRIDDDIAKRSAKLVELSTLNEEQKRQQSETAAVSPELARLLKQLEEGKLPDFALKNIELIKAQAQAAFNALKQNLDEANKANDFALDQNLISVRDHAQARLNLVLQELDAERKAKQKELQETQAAQARFSAKETKDPEKALEARIKVKTLEGEIKVLQEKRTAAANEAARTELKGETALADELARVKGELDGILHNLTAPERKELIAAQLQATLDQFKAAGNQQGEAAILRLIDVKATEQDLQAVQRQISIAFDNLSESEKTVQLQMEAGLLTEIEGRRTVVELHRQSAAEVQKLLPLLEEAVNKLNTPEAKLALVQFKNRLKELTLVVDETAKAIDDASKQALGQMFSDIVSGFKSGSEAAHDFAQSVLHSFFDVISKRLGEKLFDSLFAKGGGLGAFGSSILGFFGIGGTATGKAEGGPIVGPGTGTSDSIPAIGPGGRLYALANGEWIVRAAAVRYWGDAFMQRINDMGRLATPRYSFAAGGPVAGPSQRPAGAALGVPGVQVIISPDMAHMTLRDWLEGHLARELANR